MNPESATPIDLELQRLHRWLSLLEQWGDGLRSAPDALVLAQHLCRLLVDTAQYAQAEIALSLPDGLLVSASAAQADGAGALRDIHFPVVWHGQPLGALRLWAEASAPERAARSPAVRDPPLSYPESGGDIGSLSACGLASGL